MNIKHISEEQNKSRCIAAGSVKPLPDKQWIFLSIKQLNEFVGVHDIVIKHIEELPTGAYLILYSDILYNKCEPTGSYVRGIPDANKTHKVEYVEDSLASIMKQYNSMLKY